MTAAERMAARIAPLSLVIFDCDGVIVDSEPISSRVVAREVSRLGWPLTQEEADRLFLGKSLTDIVVSVETHLRRSLPTGWAGTLAELVAAEMRERVESIPGALDAIRAVSEMGLPWRVASNSSHGEMRAKFGRVGIADLTEGRTHSFTDVKFGKPAPDVFLAAATAQGVPPAECIVIEDSLTGIRAAIAAGMDCLAFAPLGDADAQRDLGAYPFRSMAELPDLIRLAVR